eukprot:3264599-Heterocapsa_arctica.AAC.1
MPVATTTTQITVPIPAINPPMVSVSVPEMLAGAVIVNPGNIDSSAIEAAMAGTPPADADAADASLARTGMRLWTGITVVTNCEIAQ